VDPLTQIRITRELVDIDSTTGREGAAGEYIARLLEGLGYDVTRQPVSDGRFNVFARPFVARKGVAESTPRSLGVVFSTHFDCVPPFFASREEDGLLYGRGSCDAKGTLVAQIAAAEALRASGRDDVGLLFVVGEERGSDGARVANDFAPGSRFLINGEPTDNRLAAATRGVYRARLRATGRAAHSSRPELGESAIDKLIDALVALRGVRWPVDPLLGETFYTTGLIGGGVAPNVISPHAHAELMFRTIGPHEDLRRLLDDTVGASVAIEDVLVVPPVRLVAPAGFDTEVFSFTTDIPFLDRWGQPLLIGPGSVTVAHTDDERVQIDELHHAAKIYADLARAL
jgi:acetylornithine deacetylase